MRGVIADARLDGRLTAHLCRIFPLKVVVMVPVSGIELLTYALRVRCSTN